MAKSIDDELSRVTWDVTDVDANLEFLNGLKEKTGHSMKQWFKLIDTETLRDPLDRIKYLMTHADHKFNYRDAYVVVARHLNAFPASFIGSERRKMHRAEVDEMFAGEKAPLRPVMAKLVKTIRSIGQLQVTPLRDMFAVSRKYTVARIIPRKKFIHVRAHRSIDEVADRRILQLHDVEEVDAKVQAWFKKLREHDEKVEADEKAKSPYDEFGFYDVDKALGLI
ncbi:MAG: hypothetical protein U0166_27575 [Acidobacteriota bacterium]